MKALAAMLRPLSEFIRAAAESVRRIHHYGKGLPSRGSSAALLKERTSRISTSHAWAIGTMIRRTLVGVGEQARPFARQTRNQGINSMLALRKELIDTEE